MSKFTALLGVCGAGLTALFLSVSPAAAGWAPSEAAASSRAAASAEVWEVALNAESIRKFRDEVAAEFVPPPPPPVR